ncbi:MAG: UDP-N-acetylmuramate--L-alanine ligase [Eubacteriales bacterium]|nr:UDP-N-acetylmuramate--L-alanine ligase [Eubacteriales bacterium]
MSDFSLHSYVADHKSIHLVGIGGVSMSALAELLMHLGAVVTGSDRSQSDVTDKLTSLGAKITYAHLPENVEGADLIIRTAAVHDDNPEIVHARALGIPVIERAQAWGSIMLGYQNAVCVSGTHGKTTTTSMLTLIGMHCGVDPTVMVGSNLPAIGGTLRIGAHDCFIAESCEYTNSFLSFHPTVAVVLNVDADHLDFFKDIDDIIHSFHRFCELVPETGAIVVNHDSANALKAVAGIDRTCITFGSTPEADVYPQNVTDRHGYYSFDVMHKGTLFTHVDLSVPGHHNMLNALASCAVCIFLGLDATASAAGLSEFTGSSRRFQLTGHTAMGTMVIDDYAHHPAEMTATLKTAREMDYDRILCVFQPHTYSRTKALLPEFIEALKLCDKAILADIYAAREQNTYGISSKVIADALDGGEYYDSFEKIEARLLEIARPGDLIITMGAGNVNVIGSAICTKE